MALTTKHKFISAKGDPSDATLVRPSNWNDSHDITMAADNVIGRATTGAGAAEEIPCTAQGRALMAASDYASLGMFTTGDVKITLKQVADAGWVMMNDLSIGDASSNASARANDDTADLFAVVWAISASYVPIYTSAGVLSTRGATAAADFAAHKQIRLPLVLGRALAVAGAGSGLTGRALGQFLGEEIHTLSQAEMPVHTHGISDPGHSHSLTINDAGIATGGSGGTSVPIYSGSQYITDTATTNITINNAGSGGAHNNMQPTAFLNIMVKL